LYNHRKYNKPLQKLLFLPIQRALFERKISYREFVSMCALNGLKTSIGSLKSMQQGNHHFAEHFNLYAKMYLVLDIPEDKMGLNYFIECDSIYNKLKPQKKKLI
jgi:hypothetical protein